jgi:6-phosphogluconolactonase
MRNNTEIKVLPNPAAVFQEAAADFSQRAKAAVEKKGEFTVVLAGGNSVKNFFDVLVEFYKQQIPWDQIQFFFGDERYVPIADSANNYHTAYEHLFSKVAVPAKNIHRIPTEFKDPKKAAAEYQLTLQKFFHMRNNELPPFDLVYLGLGDNAHTASLMPLSEVVLQYTQNPLPANTNQLVATVFVSELNMYRVTLTPPAINNAKNIIFLVIGVNKATAVWEVLEGPVDPSHYPAQLIHGEKIVWYIDQAAASKLKEVTSNA